MAEEKVKERFQVKVQRFNPAADKQPYFKEYKIPCEHGLTVLMALNHIYERIDPSLAYYYSCRTGKCAGCTLVVNGKTVQSCVTTVEGDIVVEPARGFEIVKDLVVDFRKPITRK